MKLWFAAFLSLASVATVSAAVAPPAPLPPVPTPSQLAWQRMEMTMFLHFGVTASKVRLMIAEAGACPAIAEFGVFKAPQEFGAGGSGSLAAHKPAVASNVHSGGTEYGGYALQHIPGVVVPAKGTVLA